jgi:hypothetical protein
LKVLHRERRHLEDRLLGLLLELHHLGVRRPGLRLLEGRHLGLHHLVGRLLELHLPEDHHRVDHLLELHRLGDLRLGLRLLEGRHLEVLLLL